MSALAFVRAVAVTVIAAAAAVQAQQPAQPPAQPPQAAPQPSQPAAQAPPESSPQQPYSYRRDGRRDPFVSLIGRGTEVPGGDRPAGLAGMLINEVSLKGIMRHTSGYVAMVQGTDKKTYIVRPGQRLLDGTVKSITQDTVVFSQDVNDPLSLVKQREVRKTLRTSEEGRG